VPLRALPLAGSIDLFCLLTPTHGILFLVVLLPVRWTVLARAPACRAGAKPSVARHIPPDTCIGFHGFLGHFEMIVSRLFAPCNYNVVVHQKKLSNRIFRCPGKDLSSFKTRMFRSFSALLKAFPDFFLKNQS